MGSANKRELPIIISAFIASLYFGYKLPGMMSGLSLGSMVKTFIPLILIIFVGYLITFVSGRMFSFAGFVKRKDKLGLGILTVAIVVSVILGLILSSGTTNLGLTYIGIGLLVLGGMVYSVWCYLTGLYINGLVTFFLVLPFLSFLEWDFKSTWFAGGPLGPIMVSPNLIFIWICFMALLASLTAKRVKITIPYIGVLTLFLGWMLLSAIFAKYPIPALREWWMHATTFPLIAVLAVNSVRSLEDSGKAIIAFAGYVLMRIAIVYYFYGQAVGFKFYLLIDMYNSLMGMTVIFHIGILAIMAITVFPILISWIIKEKNYIPRILWVISLLFILWITFVLQLRSTMLAILITLPFLLMYMKISVSRIVGTAFLLVVVSAIITYFSPQVLLRFAPWYSVAGIVSDQVMRLDAWQAALKMIANYPVLGIGPAMWTEYFPMYSNKMALIFRINSAHNPFLTYISSSGLMMMVSIFWFYYLLLKDSLTSINQRISRYEKALDIGILWSISALTMLGMLGAVSSLTFIGWVPGTYGVTTVVDVLVTFGFIVGTIKSRSLLKENQSYSKFI